MQRLPRDEGVDFAVIDGHLVLTGHPLNSGQRVQVPAYSLQENPATRGRFTGRSGVEQRNGAVQRGFFLFGGGLQYTTVIACERETFGVCLLILLVTDRQLCNKIIIILYMYIYI